MPNLLKTNKIAIGFADDHKAIRQALVFSLSCDDSLHFIFEAGNGKELLTQLTYKKPDVLLLDVRMPVLSGIEALKIISEKYPEIKVLVLSAFIDEVYVAQCLQYGIYGYLEKSMAINEIIKAIKLAHNNEMYFSNLMGTQLYKQYLSSFNHSNKLNILPNFNDDEIRILKLLQEEKTTEEISTLMNLSKRSIEIKRDKMREKAKSKTVGGLLLYALKRGIID